MKLALFIAVGLPLVLGPWLGLLGRVLGRRVGWVALGFPVLSLAALVWLALESGLPSTRVVSWPWVPSLGIQASFLVDGLSLFFALVVSGMGVLVFWYANSYLDDHYEHHGRFYTYLTLFMAAMLGTVLANDLILLFVFWELTGLASFLLIGFLHTEESARVGARQALLVTGATGLLLLVGVLMVRQEAGTHELARLLEGGVPAGEAGRWFTAALFLMLLGAFGKSAQFPFHFWLPNAMAAPTPVSAYLHSATMVKLGVFLCARLFPLFAEHALWAPLLAGVGFGTMVLGAVLALLSHDLKAILAFSTVSQLGSLIGYYGLGPASGVEYDYLHILNHVFYKGSLFMIAGVVIHSTGLQDIRQLGGLGRRLPGLAGACAIACAAMVGVFGTTGFLSKEMMLKEIFAAMPEHGVLGRYVVGCVLVASVVKVAFAARFFVRVFLGPEPPGLSARFHAPSRAFQLPAWLLAAATVGFGLAPAVLEWPLHALTVPGLHRSPAPLSLWHGATVEFWVSLGVLGLGAILFVVGQRTDWRWARIAPGLQFDTFFETGLTAFFRFTKALTSFLQADRPVVYLPILLAFTLAVVGGWTGWALKEQGLAALQGAGDAGWTMDGLRGFTAGLIALAVLGVVGVRRWTTQLISLSVAGFLITFYFVLYRAPDLALTQILIEVVTLVLVLLLLGRFPRSAEKGEWTWRPHLARRWLNGVLAVGVGVLMTVLVLWVNARPAAERVGERLAARTKDLAEGTNAVNTTLIDFRGFDTLGEITVLLIATLGALGLLLRYKRIPEEYRQGPRSAPGMDLHPPRKDA